MLTMRGHANLLGFMELKNCCFRKNRCERIWHHEIIEKLLFFPKEEGSISLKIKNPNKQNKNSGNNSKSKEMNAASCDCTSAKDKKMYILILFGFWFLGL